MELKSRIGFALASVGALALAGCSSTPKPAPVQVVEAPKPKPTLPYRWTQGNAEKAREAMVAAFGETSLKPGDFLWAPTIPDTGETSIVVDLLTQMAFVYRDDQLIGVTTISSGKKGKETPLGFWSVNRKQKMGRSNKYENAPMPFMQVIDDHGIALHGGKLPGYPASHGCVRLPLKFAEKLYTLTKVGTKVTIEG
jgi:lipoprotein-anchoring transpeptidase ErfK/SrfK